MTWQISSYPYNLVTDYTEATNDILCWRRT